MILMSCSGPFCHFGVVSYHLVLEISLGIEKVDVFLRFLPLVGGHVRRPATRDET